MKTYLRHRIVNVIDIKELIALEYLDFEGKYKDYSESHDFWELCYVQEGGLQLITDGEKTPLSMGEMIIISPGKQHSYTPDAMQCKAYVVCFESQSQALCAIAHTPFVLSSKQKNCMEIVIEEATETFELNARDQLQVTASPKLGGQQAIISQLEYLLICTLRQVSAQKNANVIFLSENNFYAGITDVMLEYFRQNVRQKLSLTQICRKMNYSRSFICKTFKDQTGETIITCFNRMKIEEAKRLLTETDLTVSQISHELGFSDPKYFNTIFKKHSGQTPAVFRKSQK